MPLDPAAQLFCSFTIEKTEDRQERAALVQLPSGHRDQEQPLVPAHAVGAQFQAGTGTGSSGCSTDTSGVWSGLAFTAGLASLSSCWTHSRAMRRVQASLSNRMGFLLETPPALWADDTHHLLPSQGFPGLLRQEPVTPGGAAPQGCGPADTAVTLLCASPEWHHLFGGHEVLAPSPPLHQRPRISAEGQAEESWVQLGCEHQRAAFLAPSALAEFHEA